MAPDEIKKFKERLTKRKREIFKKKDYTFYKGRDGYEEDEEEQSYTER